LKEIELEVKAVARWFHASVKKASLLNAQMSIITEIARIFRESGQFDEEQACMNRLRDLNRRWYYMRHPWFVPFWPVRCYLEKMVGSFPLFVAAVLSWPILFGLVSSVTKAQFDGSLEQHWGVWSHITNAYGSFFGLQPMTFPMDPAAKVLSLIVILVGFMHLGILIAHLYTLITRK